MNYRNTDTEPFKFTHCVKTVQCSSAEKHPRFYGLR